MAQDFLSQLFGTPPDYSGSFTPPTQEQAQTNALSQGGLQALISLLGASGQTTRPVSTGQILGGALSAGLGGYQSSFDNTLKQILTSQKIEEEKRKRESLSNYRQAIARSTTSLPQNTMDMLSPSLVPGEIPMPPVQIFDPQKAQNIALKFLAENDPTAYLTLVNPKDTKTPDIKNYEAALAGGYQGSFTDYLGNIANLKTPDEFVILTPAQKLAEGLAPNKVFQRNTRTKDIKEVGGGGVSVNTSLNTGENQLSKFDAEAIQAISNRVNSARTAANTAQAINDLLAGKKGGEIVKIGASLAQSLGLKSETADANALANALQVSAATQVRAAGSGSTSDLEFKSFLSVFPSLSTSEAGRKIIADGLLAFAKRDALIETEARRLFKDNKYSASALFEYDQSLGPAFDITKIIDPTTSKPFRRNYN